MMFYKVRFWMRRIRNKFCDLKHSDDKTHVMMNVTSIFYFKWAFLRISENDRQQWSDTQFEKICHFVIDHYLISWFSSRIITFNIFCSIVTICIWMMIASFVKKFCIACRYNRSTMSSTAELFDVQINTFDEREIVKLFASVRLMSKAIFVEVWTIVIFSANVISMFEIVFIEFWTIWTFSANVKSRSKVIFVDSWTILFFSANVKFVSNAMFVELFTISNAFWRNRFNDEVYKNDCTMIITNVIFLVVVDLMMKSISLKNLFTWFTSRRCASLRWATFNKDMIVKWHLL